MTYVYISDVDFPKFQGAVFKLNMTYVYISDVECPKCQGNIFSYGNFTKQKRFALYCYPFANLERHAVRAFFHQFLSISYSTSVKPNLDGQLCLL